MRNSRAPAAHSASDPTGGQELCDGAHEQTRGMLEEKAVMQAPVLSAAVHGGHKSRRFKNSFVIGAELEQLRAHEQCLGGDLRRQTHTRHTKPRARIASSVCH